jgi:hypothetical protein
MSLLTNREKEIVELVYKFRFINRHQIQKTLNHKDARRINAWLKGLTQANFLGRIYSHKLLENTKPAIYYLSGVGIRYIKEVNNLELKDVKKFYQDKNASQKFIDHCINVSEFCIKMRVYEMTNDAKYFFLTKTECYTNELLSQLKPDLYITKTKNKETARFFMDIFDPHVPRYALRYRIKQYIEFYEEWYEEEKFPYVLLVLPDQKKMKHLMKYTSKQDFDEGLIFQFTTIDNLLKEEMEKPTWKTNR